MDGYAFIRLRRPAVLFFVSLQAKADQFDRCLAAGLVSIDKTKIIDFFKYFQFQSNGMTRLVSRRVSHPHFCIIAPAVYLYTSSVLMQVIQNLLRVLPLKHRFTTAGQENQ